MKKSKRIELSEDAIRHWSIEAINNGTNFKNYIEWFLERIQGKYEFHENPTSNVRGTKKNKNK